MSVVQALRLKKSCGKLFCISFSVLHSTSGEEYLSEQGIYHTTAWHLWHNELALFVITSAFLLLTYIQLRRTNTAR